MASALQKAQTHDDRVHGSRKVKVTILASEWGSSNGGLSTINRELAIQLAKFPEVEITFFLPKCSQEDKNVALDHKVKIVEATPLPCFEQLDWLCFPPDDLEIDIVVGHGVKLGKQAQVIKKSKRCKWIQVVHTDPEELGMFKNFSNPISEGEEKHKTEVELCKMADHVVGVGPKLSDAFRSYLRGCKKDDHVLDFTPGVLDEFEAVNQDPSERQQRSVLVFGRGDVDDFELKGLDIAGKAIAALQDTRLMFVGALDGKHEEIAKRLIECGVPASRLRVRGFAQDRESLKRLFQEVDLAVMPSRTEGFGLTGLEAMSAGLPVLVSRNSGFGEALRSAAFGSSFVIDSEDPAVWTVAIQNILSKDRECRLEEAVTLRDSYARKYNWVKQTKELVDRMINLAHEPVKDNNNNPRTNSYDDKQLVSETSHGRNREKKVDATSGNQTETSTVKVSQSQNSRKRKMSESSCDPGAIVKVLKLIISAPDLSDEQQENLDDILEVHARKYLIHHSPLTREGLSAFFDHLVDVHNLSVKSVQKGSLIITVECPTLESLERLWNDYQSGCLNDIAESYLVTDELKRKLGLDHVRLRITIEEENYLICKKALMEIAGVVSITETSSQTVDSGQEEDTRWSEGRKQAVSPMARAEEAKNKKLVLTHMERAEEAKASRSPLHKAAISGQYETVKMLLESGEDVDLKDQFSLTPLHLACWYGHESVVRLLLEHGANVNAEDRFQRTPLQKAERREHHSIVQLLRKNDARPSFHQPVSLRELSRKAFLQVDKQSGFNLLQAAVLDGEKPSHYSIKRLYNEWAKNNSRLTELQWGTSHHEVEQAVEFVLSDCLDINTSVSDNDWTALLRASRSSSSQFIETLIDLGADVNAQRKEKKETPLILAADWNNYMAAYLLVRHGADVNVQISTGFTPLQLSVQKNHENLIKLLLANKVDVNIQDNNGYTALHWCAKEGHENLCRLLLEHNADVNMKDYFGDTLLHWCAKEGHENLCRLLLEHNADVNMKDYFGATPLHRCVREGNGTLCRLLLEHNAYVNMKDSFGDIPLHRCIRESNENLCRLLLEHNADVNIHDEDGYTPLHWCAREGNEIICRLLLEHKADVNIQDEGGYTPLHWCVSKGNEIICRLLLEHKADVNIQDEGGYTPLHWCVRKGNEIICRLLLEHNEEVNIQDNYRNIPLHWCAREGNGNICRLILKNNADVNFQDAFGYTPLHLSASKGNENLCRLLFEHNADVNIPGYDGCTPLHLSTRGNRDCSKIIDLLVKYGKQNIDIRNAEGLTPLQMAVRHGNARAVKKLVKPGADVSVVKADETDAKRLKLLKKEAKRKKQDLKFQMGTAQKTNETKYITNVASVRGAERLEEFYLQSEKIRRRTLSYTYTTQEIQEDPEAITSSRRNRCVTM